MEQEMVRRDICTDGIKKECKWRVNGMDGKWAGIHLEEGTTMTILPACSRSDGSASVSLLPWVCWSEQGFSVLSDLNLRGLIQVGVCLSNW